MKLKIIILAFVLAVSFYFRADILKLYSFAFQKTIDIERASMPIFNRFKEGVSATVNDKSQVFAPPPLKTIQEASKSFLTLAGTIAETNIQRTENNLPSLEENPKLDEAAKAKADDLFKYQYFEHISPSGRGPAELAGSAGYDFLVIGENLALGNFENDKKLMAAWMASPGHRANILNSKYSEIGVAVKKGIYEGRSVWIAVQEFGRPASDCIKVSAVLEAEIGDYSTRINAMVKTIEAEKANLERLRAENISEYNKRVNDYNNLIQQHNLLVVEMKVVVTAYNNQVRAYNECLK